MQSTQEINGEVNESQNPLKKWVVILGILAGLFFLSTLYFGIFAKPVTNLEYIKVTDEKESLTRAHQGSIWRTVGPVERQGQRHHGKCCRDRETYQ